MYKVHTEGLLEPGVFRKIRKQILKFSFEPKNERKYFYISALASKNPKKLIRPLFKGFLKLGQKYKNMFVCILVQIKTLKFAFKINWPLIRHVVRKIFSKRIIKTPCLLVTSEYKGNP